ncbi:kinase-like domain-containing protein [Roridomyces roridus]|uniref:Kinase-like domain-containing protein n=1 Tax=Roridomyces roridus TaxID=1738132 RepID=A0AAD7CEE0_9AGAR|nr:kinase-like domain-containing protein [Roridomyces roridus]
MEGDSAQYFLDFVQDAVDRGFLIAPEENKKAQRIIRKLSEASDRLPSSLFIKGVTARDVHPTFGGGFSDVYRALYDKRPVALKRMRYFLEGADLRRINLKFCREALVWKDLHHPYIVPFIGIDRDSFPSSLCMVSPWMKHGTVLSYLKENGEQAHRLLFEIAQGLRYLHSRTVVHGDLRGVLPSPLSRFECNPRPPQANILIDECWSACLSDFGLSSFSDATTSMQTSTRAGSIYWMAPELIAPERFGFKFSRTQASDVYAFACVCVELYAGRPPFSHATEAAALFAVVNGERPPRPSGMPDTLWRLVSECWSENPRTRPSSTVVAQNMTLAISEEPKTSPSGSSSLSGPSELSTPKPLAANRGTKSQEDCWDNWDKEIRAQRSGFWEKLKLKGLWKRANEVPGPTRAMHQFPRVQHIADSMGDRRSGAEPCGPRQCYYRC